VILLGCELSLSTEGQSTKLDIFVFAKSAWTREIRLEVLKNEDIPVQCGQDAVGPTAKNI
jgi:hypothetical protein